MAEVVIRREFMGGAENVTWDDFVQFVVQDDEVALMVAEEMLLHGPYTYNDEEPEFREVFTVINREAVMKAVAEGRS